MKSQLNFQKIQTGQTLNFSKDFGAKIDGIISFNLNWGQINGMAVDLDAFLVMEHRGHPQQVQQAQQEFPKAKSFWERMKDIITCGEEEPRSVSGLTNQSNTIYFGNKVAKGVIHHGDDRTGAWSKGEFIEIDLNKIPEHIDTLTFSVLSFSGHSFGSLPFASIKVFTGKPNQPQRGLVEHELTRFNSSTMTVVIARMMKINGEWTIEARSDENRCRSTSDVTRFCKGIR